MDGAVLLDPARPLHLAHAGPGLTIATVSIDWLRDQPSGRLAGIVSRHLSPGEREHAAALRLPKRRVEWLAGRLAAKHAVRVHRRRRLGITGPTRDISVDAVPEGPRAGKPRVNAPVEIAISHSAGFAVAACGCRPVGIDVERHREISPVLARRISSVDRPAAAGPHDRLPLMPPPLRWTCKEAVLKYFGFGLRVDVREVRLTGWRPDGGFTWSPGPALRSAAAASPWPGHGWAREIGGYALALVW
ncbi:4'-phosphopantetheinyl transferase superfamily protein [Actinomadura rubrisoli]|uniref:4'-phosphopantetheinyl transferase superfamily protein n=1 Tax=Actinomadura rubrisoli TaxID=2530368 RepID=A0A4R5B696_9ACTN|nr:4'-phosphopantetheinyl transferase superfamily protein [Actinomadura rubrisoli]